METTKKVEAPIKVEPKKETKKKNLLWDENEDDDDGFLKKPQKGMGTKLPGMVAGITKPSEAKLK